ncbi:unnamed protein product [Toxocara canis]|uniref:Uncharacterized protein n=1 Tax=Toxocara canis TaxID=6265 RepID=A0A3P7H4R2_TOXCA|nr:unnamed protein product [Toxocara canis]
MKETNKGNVSRRKSATPKQSSKRAAKWHSESRDSRCHHVTSKRRRT